MMLTPHKFSFYWKRYWPLLVGALGVMLVFPFSGCNKDQIVSEAEERAFRRGQQLLKENKQEEAFFAFLKVIEKRKDAPESHLEVGRLQMELYKDPIAAIYHFRQYLQKSEEKANFPFVKQLIEGAKRDFASHLKVHPEKDHIDVLDLTELLKSTREENLQLKQQIVSLEKILEKVSPQSLPKASTVKVSTQKPVQNFRTKQYYKIQSGDTLSKISSKVYGVPKRWKDIFDANRHLLKHPNTLVVGTELRIPH